MSLSKDRRVVDRIGDAADDALRQPIEHSVVPIGSEHGLPRITVRDTLPLRRILEADLAKVHQIDEAGIGTVDGVQPPARSPWIIYEGSIRHLYASKAALKLHLGSAEPTQTEQRFAVRLPDARGRQQEHVARRLAPIDARARTNRVEQLHDDGFIDRGRCNLVRRPTGVVDALEGGKRRFHVHDRLEPVGLSAEGRIIGIDRRGNAAYHDVVRGHTGNRRAQYQRGVIAAVAVRGDCGLATESERGAVEDGDVVTVNQMQVAGTARRDTVGAAHDNVGRGVDRTDDSADAQRVTVQDALLLDLPLIHHVFDNFLGSRNVAALLVVGRLERQPVDLHLGIRTSNTQTALLFTRDLRLREEACSGGNKPATPLHLHVEEEIVTSIRDVLGAEFPRLRKQYRIDREDFLPNRQVDVLQDWREIL